MATGGRIRQVTAPSQPRPWSLPHPPHPIRRQPRRKIPGGSLGPVYQSLSEVGGEREGLFMFSETVRHE